MAKPSKIFSPYRALGFVSNHVPLSLRYIQRRKENLVVTIVGKCFHTYGCDKLTLLSVSNLHPDEIDSLASDSYLVFTSCKNVIYAWRRGTELKHTYKGHEKNVHLLLPFGPHLLSVDEDSTLIVWDIKSEDITMELPFSNATFSITAVLHPSTYLNKILFGSKQGTLQIWNLRTSKLIYEFKGWNSPVTALAQAPAIDVAAIGLLCGNIYIHNLKCDMTIMKFFQDWGPVTAISFRTDGHPIMTSASSTGHIAVWDLEKKKLHSEMRQAHKGAVTGMKFLPNEPLLVTSSPDNTLKMWIFDMPDDGGRLLKLREGHSEAPIKIRFHGSSGKNILSSGLDSTLRSFSTAVDNLNKNLGQASYNRKRCKRKGIKNDPGKMPPIVDFTSETTREKEWDNIAACHRGLNMVTTWTFDHCRMGEHKLTQQQIGQKDVTALCLALSACGNYVTIGYSSGHINKFNIQSGLFRGSFGEPETAHDGSVRSLVCDGLNQILVSGGADKKLKFWRFKKQTVLQTLDLPFSIARMILHRENSMIAVAMDDFTVLIVDQDTRRIVRKFEDHSGQITDMAFSADCRWLIVASMDSTIKTWDLSTGNLLDCFLVSPVCVSLSMSPSSDYLATAHAGDLGIYLWTNATLYNPISLFPLSRDYEPQLMSLPTISLEGKTTEVDEADENEIEMDHETDDDIPEFKSPEQIADDLVTLSTLPSSRWKNLLNLDIIKMRNKPSELVKSAKSAPFFLPVVSGLKPTFDVNEDEEDKKRKDDSKMIRLMQHGSAFTELLSACDETESYDHVMTKLMGMTPSMIDVEIRCLSPENGGSVPVMLCFMKAMNHAIKTKRNFQVVQAYLALFLQIHGGVIADNEELWTYLSVLKGTQATAWTSLEKKFNECLSFVNYLRSSFL